MLTVLPPALVAAAASVRSCVPDLQPGGVRGADGALGQALDDFADRWDAASTGLADDVAAAAALLLASAARYDALERLLVPAALR